MAATPVSPMWDGTRLLFQAGAATKHVLTQTELDVALGSANASCVKTTDETATLLAAHPTLDRAVLVMARVDETLAAVGGSAPQFSVGETTTGFSTFLTSAQSAGQVAGVVLMGGGVNTAGKDITVTGTAADGTSTGGITVTVMAIPIS